MLTRLASSAFPQLTRFLNDPRLDLRTEDARIAFLRDEARYDLIQVDPPRPHSAYAGNLYSVEFFRLAARRLKPGGLMCTWVPTRRVRNSFLSVFPHAVAFAKGNILVGSLEPLRFEPEQWAGRLRTSAARDYLGGLAGWVARAVPDGRPMPREAVNSVETNRDLFPRDEFRTPD